MKTFRYAIVSAILALGIAAPVFSAEDAADPGKDKQQQRQRPGGGNRGGGFDMTAPLLKGITLTAEQQKKVDAIKADTQKQMQGLAREDMRTKGRELMQAEQTQVRAVLTADQQKVFDENLKNMPQRGGPGGKGGGQGGGQGGGKRGGGQGGGQGGGKRGGDAPAPKAEAGE